MRTSNNSLRNGIASGALILSAFGCQENSSVSSSEIPVEASLVVQDSREALMERCIEANPLKAGVYRMTMEQLKGASEGLKRTTLEVKGAQPGSYDGDTKLEVNLETCGMSSTAGRGFQRCEDQDGNGEWENIIPVGCSHSRIPADAYYHLEDKTKRPAEWQRVQKTCNDRVAKILDSNR